MTRKKTIKYDENNRKIEFIYNQQQESYKKNNRKEREKMLIFLRKAIENELTHKQKYCVTEYFINNKKMSDIANELGIDKSAVTRHIQRAVKKIKNKTIYIF